MTGLETLLKDFWAVLLALLSAVGWLSRLENKVRTVESRQFEDRANQRAEKEHFDKKLDAIQDDIKQLIRAIGEK